MSRQAVEGVAGGRVWTGAAAQKIGLVDDLGGLDRAIELAREEAGIEPGEMVGIDFHPAPPSWLGLLFERSEPRLPGSSAAGSPRGWKRLLPACFNCLRSWPDSSHPF